MEIENMEIRINKLMIELYFFDKMKYRIFGSEYGRTVLINFFDQNGNLEHPVLTLSPYAECIMNEHLTIAIYSSVYGLSVCINILDNEDNIISQDRLYLNKNSKSWTSYFSTKFK